MKKKVISIILIIVMLQAYVCSVIAVTTSELNGQKSEIQNKINDTKNEQAEVKQELDAEMKAISQLDAEIDEAQGEIDKLNAQINEVQASITEKENLIKEKQKEYDSNEELLKQRIVIMYEIGETTFLDILFNSKSIVDFISNYYTVSQIVKYDSDLLQTIEDDKNAIENAKKELEEQRTQIETLKNDKVSKQNAIKAKRASRQEKANKLNAEQKALQAEIDKYNSEKKKIEDELKKLSTTSGSGNHVYTGGKLTWPCPGYSRITSYFGYRGSSATGGVGSSYHKGIDLGAARGTAILAAESGIVTTVYNGCTHDYGKTYSTRCSCGGGFGNYIMISHGSGLSTIYAHCSSISVRVGQNVTAGQQIGKVGSTGYSTGNHLHFGVIKNGVYVNPASYLGM